MAYSAVVTIIGIILAIGATVVLYILVMPEDKKDRLNGFFKVVRSIFNFDSLLLEKILKILYAFSTLACIIIGFLMLFYFETSYSFYSGRSRTTWYGWIGLLIMILGPVIIRIIYEYSLLLVFGVSRLMSIDKKIPGRSGDSTPDPEAPAAVEPVAPAPVAPAAPETVAPVAPDPVVSAAPEVTEPFASKTAEPEPKITEPEPVYRFCTKCGTKYDVNKGGCPNGCK